MGGKMGRSGAVKPTRAQKVLISTAGLVVRNWLVISDTEAELRLVSRRSGATRVIKKGPRQKPDGATKKDKSVLF